MICKGQYTNIAGIVTRWLRWTHDSFILMNSEFMIHPHLGCELTTNRKGSLVTQTGKLFTQKLLRNLQPSVSLLVGTKKNPFWILRMNENKELNRGFHDCGAIYNHVCKSVLQKYQLHNSHK